MGVLPSTERLGEETAGTGDPVLEGGAAEGCVELAVGLDAGAPDDGDPPPEQATIVPIPMSTTAIPSGRRRNPVTIASSSSRRPIAATARAVTSASGS
jgi:hypothetical protein